MIKKNVEKSDLLLWLFVGWVVAVIVFSVVPLSREWKALYENRFVRGDYLLHFLVFFVGFLLYRLNVREASCQWFASWPRAPLILVFVFALLAEAVQLLIPSRTFNLYDVLANYTGVAFGMAVLGVGVRRG